MCSYPALNVCDYTLAYMNRTLAFRAAAVAADSEKPTQLFLSWITKCPVTKQTIARWLKFVLKLSGISQYRVHSYRGAGLSKAFAKGASIEDILKAGNWTTVKTFKRFYSKPSDTLY